MKKMLAFSATIFLTLCVVCPATSGQVKQPQLYIETARPIKMKPIIHAPEAQPTENVLRSNQITAIQPMHREGIRVTLNDPVPRYIKLENIISALDRVAYAISRPAAIINLVRFITLALSSFFMSVFVFPNSNFPRGYRERSAPRYNPFGHLTRSEIESMIDVITRNYDETLNRAGFADRSTCRERSLCVLGDMMACDFPNIVVTVGKFAQHHLPPIDTHRNKYTKALVLGLNQTDCDRAYKTDSYECPSFKDYVKSYFHSGTRRRRDHHHHNHWRRQQ